MRWSDCLKVAAAPGVALVVAFLSVPQAEADGRPRYRAVGPVVVREPAARYWRRYFGPPVTYGSLYYNLATPRYFYPPPPYIGYGSAVGYGYPPSYYAPPYGGPVGTYQQAATPYFDPYSNPVLQDAMLENQRRWGPNLPPSVTPLRARVHLRPSTPEQQAKSIHAQVQGDVWMKKLKFLNAYERYKYAVGVAIDRPEAYFRLGYALAAIGSYDSAVKYIKQGLELDPQWPSRGDRLETVFGADNRLAILSMIERVTGWVRDDIRDPDRLFLVGVLLHFNGDQRASQFFEAAYRLSSGGGDHLLAFLQPQPESKDNVAGPGQLGAQGPYNGTAPAPAPDEPPLPLEAIPGAAMTPPGAHFPNAPQSTRPVGPSNTQPNRAPINNRALPPAPSRDSRPMPPAKATSPAAPGTSPEAAPRVPPSPALPLPPLPAPSDAPPGPQSNSQAPAGGPSLLPPTASSTTVQSP